MVAALASGGVVEPRKDVLDIARSFVQTSTNPETKDWWSRRVNSLDQLEVISTTRSLTAAENGIKDGILKDINEAAKNPNSLSINDPP